MKIKIALPVLAALIVVSLSSYSQRSKKNCTGVPTNSKYKLKGGGDTLMPPGFYTGSDTLYKYVQGGYTFGTNKLGDRAYAQVYKVQEAYFVNGIALWVGAKKQTGTADTLNVIIYFLNGPGTAVTGIVNNAPDSIRRLFKIPVNLIDTGSLTIINFPDTMTVDTDYAAGIEFSGMDDDSLGLITTRDGDADSTELVWNKYSTGNWHTVLEPSNWGMDLDLGIFMIVDTSTAGINDSYFVNGIKLSQNQPNPATGATLIKYEIETGAAVELEIYDVTGKKLISCKEGKKEAGRYEITVNTESFESGIYYYSLKCGAKRLVKKMMVARQR